jgi:predicted nucleic acid-binding protein
MIIVDTSVLVAVANERDDHHRRCHALLRTHPRPLLVPETVLTEVCWLLETVEGPDIVAVLLNSLVSGPLELAALTPDDLNRVGELVFHQRMGLVNASVVAIAERLGATELATLDHEAFSAVQPMHGQAFTFLP